MNVRTPSRRFELAAWIERFRGSGFRRAVIGLMAAGFLLEISCARREEAEHGRSSLVSDEVDYESFVAGRHGIPYPWMKDAKSLIWNRRHLLTCSPTNAAAYVVFDAQGGTNRYPKGVIAEDDDGDGETDNVSLMWLDGGRKCVFTVVFGRREPDGSGVSGGPAIVLTLGERSWVDADRYDGQWDKRVTGSTSNSEYFVDGHWLPAVASTNGRSIVVSQGRRFVVSFAETNIVLTPLDPPEEGGGRRK